MSCDLKDTHTHTERHTHTLNFHCPHTTVATQRTPLTPFVWHRTACLSHKFLCAVLCALPTNLYLCARPMCENEGRDESVLYWLMLQHVEEEPRHLDS
jgi:hypothetical protein